MPLRLAIVLSHPVQYYSPWFRHLAARDELDLKVFYLWDFGVKETRDRVFGTSFKWDIPLLEGYDSEILPNRSADPGTHHIRGLDNPGAVAAIAEWHPNAVLMFGYSYVTHLRLILSRRLARVPFYFRGDSHDLSPVPGWKPRVSGVLRRLLLRRFTGFLAVGTANADYFRASGVGESMIHRVPHCVDNDRFQAEADQAERDAGRWKQELGIPDGSTVILFAGKFEEKKRPLDLLEAFLAGGQETGDRGRETGDRRQGDRRQGDRRQGDRRQGDCEILPLHPKSKIQNPKSSSILLFVGSGHLEERLRERAGGEIGRSVFFAPFQNQTAMPMVYAAGDVLVLPSHGRGETWGLAVNEAMNLGRPAIVSSHVGCGPDLIISGETGWVFPAGDVKALGKCLAAAVSDRAELRRMGANARDHVAGFSYAVAAEALCVALRGR